MARYFLRFRHSDTGLTPTFTMFKKASDLSNVGAPSVVEVAFGLYYFDFVPTFDILFEVDGGASIPTEEVRYVSDTIGPKDAYVDETLSGVRTAIKGGDNRDLTQMAGSGFVTGTDSLKVISDNVDAINLETDPANIANAVWNELISGHQTSGSMGKFLNDIFRVLKNKAIINTIAKQLEVYDDAGSSIIFTFDLKDENGVASATRIFRRLPL